MKKTSKRIHSVKHHEKASVYLKKRFPEILKRHTTISVQRMASLDFSNVKKGNQFRYGEGAQKDHQELVSFIDQEFQGTIVISEQRKDELDTKATAEALTQGISGKIQQLKFLKAKLDEGAKELLGLIQRWKALRLLLVFLLGLELIFNYSTFFALGGNFVSSIATALLVGISLFLYTHLVPEKVKKYSGDNLVKHTVFFTLALIPVTIVFVLLAVLRLNYLSAISPETSAKYNLSPWVFVAINLFAYLVCYWLVHKYKPSKEKRERYSEYRKAINEIQPLEQEILMLKEEFDNLDPQLRERTNDRESILLLAKQLEDEVQNAYEFCLYEMRLELMLRTHGEASKFLDQSQPIPLKLNYQNITLL